MNQPHKRQTIISHNVQNISDLLNSLDYEIEESHKELNTVKQRYSNSLNEINRISDLFTEAQDHCGRLIAENLQLKEELKNTKPSSLTTEQLNKLVNDKIIDIMNNPLNYLMELPMVQRNDFVAKLIKTVIG